MNTRPKIPSSKETSSTKDHRENSLFHRYFCMLLYFHRKSQNKHEDLHRKQSAVAEDVIRQYVTYSVITNGAVLLIFFFPLLLFYYQNYETLKSIAYESFPQLLVHLEQETTWLLFFSGICFLSILVFSAFWTYKFCADITASLKHIQDHMKNIFSPLGLKASVDVQETDSLKNFSSHYESFVYNLKEETQTELMLLEKLNIDPSRKDAYKAWLDLIQIKKERLGLPQKPLKLIISNGASSGEAEHPRRVS